MVFTTQVIVAVKLKFVLELQMIRSWREKGKRTHLVL